jgi:hypothetical protein
MIFVVFAFVVASNRGSQCYALAWSLGRHWLVGWHTIAHLSYPLEHIPQLLIVIVRDKVQNVSIVRKNAWYVLASLIGSGCASSLYWDWFVPLPLGDDNCVVNVWSALIWSDCRISTGGWLIGGVDFASSPWETLERVLVARGLEDEFELLSSIDACCNCEFCRDERLRVGYLASAAITYIDLSKQMLGKNEV